jgi:hypothetical protein
MSDAQSSQLLQHERLNYTEKLQLAWALTRLFVRPAHGGVRNGVYGALGDHPYWQTLPGVLEL